MTQIPVKDVAMKKASNIIDKKKKLKLKYCSQNQAFIIEKSFVTIYFILSVI